MPSTSTSTSRRLKPLDVKSLHGWRIVTERGTDYRITREGRLLKNGVDKGKIKLIAALRQGRTLTLAEKFRKHEISFPDFIRTLRRHGRYPAKGLCLVALTAVQSGGGMHFLRRTTSPIASVTDAQPD